MSELLDVLQELINQAEAGSSCALCVVVGTKGSTPQAPGAAMLLRADCSTLGTLGGGCVEEEVKKRAYGTLTRRQSALYDFVLDHDYGWDDGLICGGKMSIAVMPITPQVDLDPFREALQESREHKPASVPVVVQHEGKTLQYRLHLEAPPTLLIAGAGHVGQAVAKLAVALDFRVVVFDDRAEYASPQRFPPEVQRVVDDIPRGLKTHPIDSNCYVVIVTRGHSHDHQALDAVIRGAASYIGLIGSKRKTRMIFRDIRDTGVPQELIDRVRTPVGLPIGAITVPEIAVSICAELIQHRRRATPKLVEGPLKKSELESRAGEGQLPSTAPATGLPGPRAAHGLGGWREEST